MTLRRDTLRIRERPGDLSLVQTIGRTASSNTLRLAHL